MSRGRVWRDMAALVAVAAVTGTTGIQPLAAQQHHRVEALYAYDGRPLDFTRDGVWRAKARQVARQRARLLRQGQFSTLNAPIAQAAFNGGALAGTLYVPTVLVGFSNTNTGNLPNTAQYDSVLYTTTPLRNPQRAYSLRTFYEEMSHGLFSVQGAAYGWFLAANTQSYYLNACSPNPDPMGCGPGVTRLGELLDGALAQVDATVDFSRYDNDGPDGVPNSGDDDGVVDLVQFVQPVVGRECNGPGYNAHHFSLSGLTGSLYVTNDPSANGGNIRINDYQIVAGVGGLACTTSSEIMAVGTAAHEAGHGLNLPDLYDTAGGSEGVGEWSLMGSGNYTTLNSPAHFDAWSLQQMGWVTLVSLTAPGRHSVGPVERSDSAFVIQPVGSNPRGEYWLLENKQAVGSDTANMRDTGTGGTSIPKHGGLAVWHVDQTQITSGEALNQVNSGPIHGVALVQADGLAQLDKGQNRGDAGDPYPGTSVNRSYAHATNPKAVMNYDTTVAAGFDIDSIYQRSDSSLIFRLLGLIVAATDTNAQVRVRDTTYHRFQRIMLQGDTATVAMDSLEFSGDSARQYVFQSWSDAGVRTHQVTVSGVDSVVASLMTRMRIRATAGTGGAVSSNPSGNIVTGIYIREDSTIVLKARPAAGKVFIGWSGDTTASADSILIHAGKPYTVLASFQDKLVASAGTPTGPVMGSAYSLQLTATGGTGSYSWQLSGGALPDGLTLSSAGLIGGVPAKTGSFSAEVRATSGVQSDSIPIALTVTAPTLVTADVVSQILGTRTPLSEDQRRYLDLLGNDNGGFDVGDFLAWVSATGAQSPAVTAAMAALGVTGPAAGGRSARPKAGPRGGAR